MGVVYAARHPNLGFEVAIKVLLAGPSAKPAQLARFRRELDALAQLQHPGLVDVLEAGEHEGRPWFAMRRVPGTNLEQRLQTQGPLSPIEVVELGRQLCQAVGHAHERGLLHRDLKPENVLCGPKERYVVTDFGLTKSLEDPSQSLSKTGAIQGTPGFWAPEQASGKGKQASPRTDVYGVGAVLYAALTGEPPIKGESVFELVVATTERPPVPPSQLASVPRPLESLVLKCLSKSPADRFESLAALESELQGALARMSRKRTPAWAWALAALGVLLALGLTATLAGPSRGPFAVKDPPATAETAETPASSLGRSGANEIDRLRQAAEAGEPKAMLALGQIYARGELAPQDMKAALGWYQRAAQLGETQAMVALGVQDLSDKEIESAVAWFRRAAEAGDAEGMGKLALCYLGFPGFDPAEGARWLRRGAEAGDPQAMTNLGAYLAEGRGVTRDLVGAVAWYRKAAAAGHVGGMLKLAVALSRGLGVTKDPSAAFRWCRKAAERGDAEGMVFLGDCYSRQHGVKQDHAEAIRWYRRAAAAGQPMGYFSLGRVHLEGRGVPKDPVEAARQFRISADQGHPKSRTELARLYVKGQGVKQDVPRGLELYKQAAAAGDNSARYDLGVILYDGVLFSRDLTRAQILLDAADGIYPSIYAFLCRAEVEGLEAARRGLRARAAEGMPPGWRGRLLRFLLGEGSEESLLKAAGSAATEEDRRARFCEAYFYPAVLRALAKDFVGASKRAKLCIRNAVEGYKEPMSSRALLRRIMGAPR